MAEILKKATTEIKERMIPKPYVVSGDIVPLLQEWAEQKGFVLPNPEFFHELREEFAKYIRNIFPGFEFVHENELAKGLAELVQESGLRPVSLDRVYCRTKPALDIARLVDRNGKDRGLGNRPGAPPLIRQFRELTKMNTKEITLVDDVVFTGDLLERVAHFLSRIDFKIPLICAGIGIGEGIKRLIKAGYNVRCVRTYEEVIDEICERDFYPGVPLSGRVLINGKNLGVPYLLPFGNPGKWASIPKEQQKPFSKFCIRQTITLFEAVEKHSNKVVCCSDLERKVVSLPRDDTPYVEALRKLL